MKDDSIMVAPQVDYADGWLLCTRTGRRFDLARPTFPDTLEALIDEATPGLMQKRFNGNVPTTLADHLLDTADRAAEAGERVEVVLGCLTHDLHEAWIGDILGPVKAAIGKDVVAGFEVPIMSECMSHVGRLVRVPLRFGDLHGPIKKYDRLSLTAERQYFMPNHPDWPAGPQSKFLSRPAQRGNQGPAQLLRRLVHLRGWALA